MPATRTFSGLLLGTLLLAGYDADRSPLASSTLAHATTIEGDGFTRIEGASAGALWAVIRPDDWNGDLVVLLHGAVPYTAPISLDPPLHWFLDPFAAALLERGFGIALSSYRANGHAVREGVLDSRVVEAQFTARFAHPRATYVVGWSMGYEVGALLTRSAESRYAGFLGVCGALGGAPVQLGRALDARVLFDYFFPGVLPADVLTSNVDWSTVILPRVAQAIQADFGSAVKLASVDQAAIEWTNPFELIAGIAGSLLLTAESSALQERAGGVPFDNTSAVYTSPLLTPAELSDLNGRVQRVEGDPNAMAYLERYHSPDGRLRATKLLTLTTARDPVVPVSLHAAIFEPLVAAMGSQDLWVRRVVPGFGHCEFGFDAAPDPFLDPLIDSFDDLVDWVRTGVRPAP